jgi:uncharacterized FlgJ-related protein
MKIMSLILLLFIWGELNKNPAKIVIAKDDSKNLEFTKENLLNYIIKIDICYPRVVMAQAQIETGHFTSKIFKDNNNLFGMKYPRQRQTTAIGIINNHSVYENWMSAVDDYKLWQDNMIHRASNKDQYISYLGRSYAKDKRYTLMIKQIIWKLDSQKE